MPWDKHIVRQGLAGQIDPIDAQVIDSYHCPFCHCNTRHTKLFGTMDDRRISVMRCDKCGVKHSRDYEDRITNEHAAGVQKFADCVWRYLSKYIYRLFEFDPQPRMHLLRGKIGNAVRNRGKPAFTIDWHPEFWKYLESPEFVRKSYELLSHVYSEDKELYDFICLKALGYSYAQMDDTGLFSGRISRVRKKKFVQTGRGASEKAKELQKQAIQLLISIMPQSVLQSTGVLSYANYFTEPVFDGEWDTELKISPEEMAMFRQKRHIDLVREKYPTDTLEKGQMICKGKSGEYYVRIAEKQTAGLKVTSRTVLSVGFVASIRDGGEHWIIAVSDRIP